MRPAESSDVATTEQLRDAVRDPIAWADLIDDRAGEIRHFLEWAAACEEDAPTVSLRLRHRVDVGRCAETMELFREPWWGVVVYSCFDSPRGTRIAAQRFPEPLPPGLAQAAVEELDFPRGSVQHHRTQSGLRGAKRALVSACDKVDELEKAFCSPGMNFDERFNMLARINVSWWGRTTHFDALLRAGALGVGAEFYSPDKAYLRGSQGPAVGFKKVFGLDVDASNADLAEEILATWTERWDDVARQVGAEWDGHPYDSGDFENALCIFQEPPHAGLPDPGAFSPLPLPRRRGKRSC